MGEFVDLIHPGPLARRFRAAAAALAVVALLVLPGTQASTAGQGPAAEESARYVVRAASGALTAVGTEVTRLGGTVEQQLRGLGAAVVTIPEGAVDRLRGTDGVLGVTPDAELQLQGSAYDANTDAGSMYNVVQLTGAKKLWSNGFTGKGVDVALIDSGVAPVQGLNSSGKVVNGPDISFESQSSNLRYLDTFGHGTFMAGLIAGNDGPITSTSYTGMAPDARVISLKVADAQGRADVSQVIAAIDWVVQHRKDPGVNIRVLNLSFGTPSLQNYVLDPLAYAAEVAWHKGIVVVVSVGNDGTGTGKLLNPAQDPFVIAVGAADSKRTPSTNDDVIPDFSTRGDGSRDPDLVAPGASLQGLRVPGSFVDQAFGATAAFEDRYFRGSGTSQAAALVSGGVALLLEQRPWLTPDQVKSVLTRSARILPAANTQAQGSGLVNLTGAASTAPALVGQTFLRSTGTGSLDAARGSSKVVLDGVALTGEKDIFGKAYVSATRSVQEAAETSWNGGIWNGSSWAGSSWAGSSWAGSSWAGSSWAGSSWAGSSWAGSSWAGSSWAGSSWAGSSWAGSSWAGSSWAGSSWAGSSWATGTWS